MHFKVIVRAVTRAVAAPAAVGHVGQHKKRGRDGVNPAAQPSSEPHHAVPGPNIPRCAVFARVAANQFIDNRIDAACDPFGVIVLAELRQDHIVDDSLHRIVFAGAVAAAHFDPHFPVKPRDQHHHAVIAAGVAHAPIVEKPGGEEFEIVRMAVFAHGFDCHDGEFDPGFLAQLFQIVANRVFLFGAQKVGEIVDMDLGVIRIDGLGLGNGRGQKQQGGKEGARKAQTVITLSSTRRQPVPDAECDHSA